MEGLKSPSTLVAVAVLAALTLACGSAAGPSPINATADNLVISTSDLSGSTADSQPLDTTYGATSGAKVVVHPGANAEVTVAVYVFGSTSDAHTGFQTIMALLLAQGQSDPNTTNLTTIFGDETVSIDFYNDGTEVMLWRRDNVVASSSGSDQHVADVATIASEQSDKIDKARP